MNSSYMLLFINLFFCSFLWGQQRNVYKDFKQLSVNEGLSHSDARSIIQDNYSFLWIGTNSGLNKYDGYSFETFKWDPNDSKSIQGNRILKLIPTKDKVWILIENKGLYYYNIIDLNFHLAIDLPELSPDAFMFHKDQNENLWLFQNKIGLITFSSNQPLSDKTLSEKITEVKIHYNEKPLPYPELKKVIEIEGKLFFFDNKGQVYQYYSKNHELKFYDSFHKGTFQLAFVLDSTHVLINCEKDLILWDLISNNKKEVSIIDRLGLIVNITPTTICQIDDTYYIGTKKGLYKGQFNFKNNHLIVEDVIPLININDIFKDKYDMLWVATSGYGLFYKNMKKLPFGHILQSDSTITNYGKFSKDYISAILKDKSNQDEIWFGTMNGLYIYSISLKKYIESIKELSNVHIRFIFQDSENDIWIGTKTEGLYRYRDKKLIKHYKKTRSKTNSICSNNIVSISEDHLGRIWLASFDNGINIYDKNTDFLEHFFNEPFNKQSIGSNKLTYLYFHKNQKAMYVSSRDAGITVLQFKGKNKIHYSHIVAEDNLKGLSTNYTWSIISNGSDTLCVGSIGGGLNILISNKNKKNNYNYTVEHITHAMGLADNDIESVLLDNQNKVWMGSRGISVYDLKTKEIINYDVEDGLQSNSFKIGSSFYDEEEEVMYFGGVNGANYFIPEEIKPTISFTDIQITGINIFNSPIIIGESINNRILLNSKISDSTYIRLKAKENEFSITYTPLNFIAPKKNEIRYKLEPYQNNWITSGYPDYSATFSNLPKGDYLFRVQAKNKAGNWHSKEAQLKIYIEPYWYKSNLALILYVFCIAGLFYIYYRYEKNQQKIKEKLIGAEKEHLLNQEKLDFFTKISHEIRTPLTLIAGPLEDLIQGRETMRDKKDVLKSMSRHTNRLLSMVNRLLDFRKMELGYHVLLASPTKINEFISEIFMFFKGKSYSKSIDYQLIQLPQDLTVYIDKEKTETLLINLLSNAFKFTPSKGSISLKLEISGDINKNAVFNYLKEPIRNYLKISITDSGKGIPFKEKGKIFNPYHQLDESNTTNTIGSGIGLNLVKSISRLHHFKIDVISKINKGSVFILRIPFGKEYLGKHEIHNEDFYKSSFYIENEDPNLTDSILEFDQAALDLISGDSIIKKKILIVEDNEDIQQYINEHVRKYFKVLNAKNGKEGFEIAQKEIPDIIISDVMMPIMDGMTFSKLIKTNDELHHIPIILLTAITSFSNELEGLKLGIEDYIRKPFKIELLLAKVFSILENRKNISDYYSKQLQLAPKYINALTEDDIFLQKTIRLIEGNLENEEFDVSFFCKEMAMGRTKLYTKIKENTGRSIVEFVRDVRLNNAKNELVRTKQSIDQISFKVGINDLKYFRKHFKMIYGMNPSEYRKQNTKLSK